MSSKPTVLVLTTTLPARPGDGTPQFVLDLSARLAQRFNVVVVAPRVPGGARLETVGGVEIRRFRYFPRRWEALADGAILPNLRARPVLALQIPTLTVAFLVAALRAAVQHRPAVIHAHWVVPGGLIAALVGRLLHVPYLVTAHGADGFALHGAVASGVKRWVIAHAAAVAAVSHDLAEALPADRRLLPVIPMGSDVSAMQALDRLAPEAGRVLFIGRLAAKKGVDVLLRALAEVEQARLVVVGEGPEEPALRRLTADLGLGTRVSFAGRLPRDQVAAELSRASVLVIPSRTADDGDRDGMPLVLPEGMGAGVPIIASRLGGLAEYIDHERTGLLVEPDDPRALATALRRLLTDGPLRSRLSRTARHDLPGSDLDLETTAARYGRLIEQAMASSAKR